MYILIVGLLWDHLSLGGFGQALLYWSLQFGTWLNYFPWLLGAVTGASYNGSFSLKPTVENLDPIYSKIMDASLMTCALGCTVHCFTLLFGLRHHISGAANKVKNA
eukprot:Opistho-2@29912